MDGHGRLCFKNVDISHENQRKLRKCLEKNKTLKCLDFRLTHLTDSLVDDVCRLLERNATLAEFRFGNSRVTQAWLSKLLLALSEKNLLCDVNFEKSRLTDDVVEPLINFIHNNESIISLNFQESRFTDHGLVKMLRSLRENKILATLNFSNSQFTDRSVDSFCKCFQENRTLTALWFGWSMFTDNGVSNILEALRSDKIISEIDLMRSHLTDDVTEDMCAFIRRNSSLVTLEFGCSWFTNAAVSELLSALSNDSTLTQINLGKSELTDDVMGSLCEAIQQNTVLQQFQLDNSKFTNSFISEMFKILCDNNSLVNINLCMSELTDNVLEPFRKFVLNNRTVNTLNLGNARLTDEMFSEVLKALCENRTLSEINFCRSQIEQSALDALCQLIYQNKVLQTLSFEKSKFTEVGLSKLLHAFTKNTNLFSFDFSNCEVTDKAVDDICEFVCHNGPMMRLRFGNSRFDEASLQSIMMALCYNDTLREMDFQNSFFTDDIAESICAFIYRNKTMQCLNIGKSCVTDTSLHTVFEVLQQNEGMQTLNFGNTTLTDASMSNMMMALAAAGTLSRVIIHDVLPEYYIKPLVDFITSSSSLEGIMFTKKADKHYVEAAYCGRLLPSFMCVKTVWGTLKLQPLYEDELSNLGINQMHPSSGIGNILKRYSTGDESADVKEHLEISNRPKRKLSAKRRSVSSLSIAESPPASPRPDGESSGYDSTLGECSSQRGIKVPTNLARSSSNESTSSRETSGKESSHLENRQLDGLHPTGPAPQSERQYNKSVSADTMGQNTSRSPSGFSMENDFPKRKPRKSKTSPTNSFRSNSEQAAWYTYCADKGGIEAELRLPEGTLSHMGLQELKAAFIEHKSLTLLHICKTWREEYNRSLITFIGARKNLKEIRSYDTTGMVCLQVIKSSQAKPVSYYLNRKTEMFVLSSAYLRDEIKDLLVKESLPSAIDVEDGKLVLFPQKAREGDLKGILKTRVKGLFGDDYKIHPIDRAVKCEPQNGPDKGNPGNKIYYTDYDGSAHYATCGSFLKDDEGRLYMISSFHGNCPDICYFLEPAPTAAKYKTHPCKVVASVYEKDPLIDTVLVEVYTKELKSIVQPVPRNDLPKAHALCGIYDRFIEDLVAQENEGVNVMKYEGKKEPTKGRLSFYDFQNPFDEISDALVISPVDSQSSFSGEGDSGSVVVLEETHRHECKGEEYSLHVGLAMLCYGVEGLIPGKKCSLAFKLEHAIDALQRKTGKKLRLLPFDHEKPK